MPGNADAPANWRSRESPMNLETAIQPKKTKEAKKFDGFTQTRPLTCRVNGGYLRTSFLSVFFVFFGHPTAVLA